jgi:hypothetical protein
VAQPGQDGRLVLELLHAPVAVVVQPLHRHHAPVLEVPCRSSPRNTRPERSFLSHRHRVLCWHCKNANPDAGAWFKRSFLGVPL